MSRPRSTLARVAAALGLGAMVLGLAACDEDGKTAPAPCLDPALPLFDAAHAGAPADDNEQYPCVTPVGHSVSYVGNQPTAGTGSNTAGSSTNPGAGGEGGAGGAGGAGGEGGAGN